jgi:hypothetical protein
MFGGKARSLYQSGAPERFFSEIGSDLTCKLKTRLEKLSRNKHYIFFYKKNCKL